MKNELLITWNIVSKIFLNNINISHMNFLKKVSRYFFFYSYEEINKDKTYYIIKFFIPFFSKFVVIFMLDCETASFVDLNIKLKFMNSSYILYKNHIL